MKRLLLPILCGGFLLAAKAFGQLDAPALVINEIHYDESDKTVPAEFVEIHNPTSESVALGGWELTGGIDFRFPEGVRIASGDYLIVAQDPATMASRFGWSKALGPWRGKLRNSGETVNLRAPGGALISKVDYRLGFPWPTVGDPVGGVSPSIQLIHPGLESDLGGSWRSAAPTPGARAPVPARGRGHVRAA